MIIPSGVELIAKERQEQIEVHKMTSEHDAKHTEGQLKFAALYALGEKNKLQPYGWELFTDKTDSRTEIGKLITAGALIAAEIDRRMYEFENELKEHKNKK